LPQGRKPVNPVEKKSRYGLVNVRLIVKLSRQKISSKWLREFLRDLPVAGERSSIYKRIGASSVLVLLVFGIRLLLNPLLGSEVSYILFVPAVMVIAWYAGIWPALLATLATLFLANVFLIEPAWKFAHINFFQIVSGCSYVFSALFVVGLTNLLHNERERVLAKAAESQQRAELLKASEEKFRYIYNHTPAMLHSIDPSGKIISVSDFWLSCLGYSREEVLGHESVEFLTPESRKFAREVVLPEYFKSGICKDVSYQMVKKNGEVIDVSLSAIAEKNAAGDVIRSLAVIIDVTARKNAEKALRSSETKLRVLAETAANAILSADARGNITQFNHSAERIFGYSQKEILGKPVFSLVPEQFQEICRREFDQLLSSESPPLVGRTTELIGKRKDGSEFPLELSLSSWEIAEGKFFTGIINDITERKQAAEALRRSEELLRTTTQAANVHLWSWDVVNDLLECPMSAELYREEPGNGPARINTFLRHVHPDDRGWVGEQIERTLREHREFNVEYRIVLPDGSVHWRHSKGMPDYRDEKPVRVSGMSMDITARKQAEEALRRSEELLRLTTESASIGLWSWDTAKNSLELNLVEFEQFNIPFGTPVNFEKFLQCIHPDDREKMENGIRACLREGRELDVEHRILRADGTIRWNHCKGRVSCKDKRIVRVSGMSLDITARKEVEESLRRQAELLNLAQVIGFDLDDKIIFWNGGAQRLYGWNHSEAIGKNIHQLLQTEFPEPLENIKAQLYATGKWEGELVQAKKNGEKITVASLWATYKDANGRVSAVLESNNNITDLKKAEAALKEARDAVAEHAKELEERVNERTLELQKSVNDMEVFCYSIAHDLRAPLRAMSGFSQTLAQDYAPRLDETGHDYCHRITAAANRMNQLISDLLAFGRITHQSLPGDSVDLTNELEKVLERAGTQIEKAHAEIELEKPLPHVCADPVVLEQVLENLLTNALKFVPAERRPRVHIYAEQSHETVRLCVEDNGIGIAPEHREKIFKPFERLHTTDYPGTGIGLALVQRGIERMGGRVGVESAAGGGSRFWIELPERCRRAF
jgi:PAS domain S-box-containing protein